MTFTAIDFETANPEPGCACALGIVTVENGQIVEEWSSLIRPPNNYYWTKFIEIHGIRPEDTADEKDFQELYPEIRDRLRGRILVAHNEGFDRSVLHGCMDYYGLDYNELELKEPWQCTLKIYRRKGFYPANLNACCKRMGIELNHHEALSDARGCAKLYLMK